MLVFTEWFWSKEAAQKAGNRLSRKGYSFSVKYKMRADGSHDWQLSVFA